MGFFSSSDGASSDVTKQVVMGNDVEIPVGLKGNSSEQYKEALTGITVVGKEIALLEINEVERQDSLGMSYTYYIAKVPSTELEIGEKTLVLKSESYNDLTLTVVVNDVNEKENTPTFVKVENDSIEVGSNAKVFVGEWGNSAYYNAFEKVIIDGVEKQKDTLGINTFSYSFEIADLDIGTHEVVLVADGYNDKSLEIDVTAKSVPTYVRFMVSGSTSSDTTLDQTEKSDVKIVVGAPYVSSSADYRQNLSVKIGDKTLETLNIQQENISLSQYYVLTISKDELVQGENTIVLSSETYKDKELKVLVQ